MRSLIRGEWKKLLQWKVFFLLVLMMLILNGILLSQQIAEDNDAIQTGRPQRINGQAASEEGVAYEDFLVGVEKQSDSMQASAVFNDSYFNRRNLEKTQEVYSRLHGIKPLNEYPQGMLFVTEYHLTDVFLLLSVAVLLMRLLIQERTDGLFQLLKTTRNGRGRLICAKYMTFVTVAFVLTVLFFCTNYFVAARGNLLGEGDAAVQSLSGYIASPFAISVGTFFYVFLLCKWAAVTAVGSVFFLLCIFCRSQLYSVLCITAVFFAELVLWTTIEDYSVLSPVRQLNLAAIMDTSHYFDDYVNFNFFGMPVSAVAAGLFTVIFASSASLILSVKLFSAEGTTDARKNRLLTLFRRKKTDIRFSASLSWGEWKKLFLMQRGLLLLVVLLVIQALFYGELQFFSDREEACYQRYSQMLEGELTEEKSAMLEAEEKRLESLESELEEKYRSFEQGMISSAVLNYYEKKLTPDPAEKTGLQKAARQYQYLKEQAAGNEHVAYIYQTGWEKLLGKDGLTAEILDFSKLLLILILAVSNLATVEKSSYVELLIQSSTRGSRAVKRIKTVWVTVFALTAAVIAFIWRPLRIADYYTLTGFEYSTKSLMFLSDLNFSMPIGVYLCIVCLIKAAIAVFSAEFVFYLSRKCQNEITVLFLGCVFFMIPMTVLWFWVQLV